jgi:hypothetical protein
MSAQRGSIVALAQQRKLKQAETEKEKKKFSILHFITTLISY